MSNKKEIRVFLSSTFKDLDEERAHLAKHTFPLLRTYCNRKGVHFSEIDLRWGLTEEDSKNGRIIRLCLDQIHDCKPFFIGILGSRYGWIPTMSDLQKDRQLKDNYPELQDSIKENRSVVEIEFEQGMLNDPQPEYQFVYAKQQEKRNPRVEELLGRVREKELMITEFSSLEQLHGAVLYDMQRAVDRYLEEANAPWADEDQLAFMTERLRSYIEHEGYSQKIDDQLALERSMTIVTGESGTGKSALMAHTIERLRQDTNKIVLGHFVGASPASRNSRGIFDHLAEQLKRNCEIDLGSTSTFSSLQDEFAFLLSKINDRGAVIVIDALDQLDEDSQPLDWLPEYLPENVHLLVSTTPGPILKRLRQREWDEFAMEPFDREEREAFVVRYLSDYGKSLNSDHVSAIAANPKCRNPLFLKMLLEEVRLSAHFTNLDETIDHYLSVKDLDGLFQLMLERLEKSFGNSIGVLFSLLYASNSGLTVTELVRASELDRDVIHEVIFCNPHLFSKPAGRLALFHVGLSKAVAHRYTTIHPIEETRFRLASSFEKSDSMERIIEEAIPVAGAENLAVIIQLLSNPKVFQALVLAKNKPQFFGARKLVLRICGNHTEELIESWKLIGNQGEITTGLYYLSRALFEVGNYVGALELCGRVLELGFTPLAEVYSLKGQCLEELGQLSEAKEAYEEALQKAEDSDSTDIQVQVELQVSLGILSWHNSDLDAARAIFDQAVKTCERDQALRDDLIGVTTNIGATYYRGSSYREAEMYFSKALTAAELAYGYDDPRLAPKLNNLGGCMVKLGQYTKAEPLLRRAVAINKDMYGSNHVNLIYNHLNLGGLYEAKRDYQGALTSFHLAYDICQQRLPPNHLLTIRTCQLLVEVLMKLDSSEAAKFYHQHKFESTSSNIEVFTLYCLSVAQIEGGLGGKEKALAIIASAIESVSRFESDAPYARSALRKLREEENRIKASDIFESHELAN